MAKVMQAQLDCVNYGFVYTDSENNMRMGQMIFKSEPANPADAIQSQLNDGTVTMCDNGANIPAMLYALTSDFNASAHDTTSLTVAERVNEGYAVNRTVKGQKMCEGMSARIEDAYTDEPYTDDNGDYIIPAITYPADCISHFRIPASDLAEYRLTHEIVGAVKYYDGADTVLSMTADEFKAIATLNKDMLA